MRLAVLAFAHDCGGHHAEHPAAPRGPRLVQGTSCFQSGPAWSGPGLHPWSGPGPVRVRSRSGPGPVRSRSGPGPVRSWSGPVLVQSWSGPGPVRSWSGPGPVRYWSGPVLVRSWSGPVLVRSASVGRTVAYAYASDDDPELWRSRTGVREPRRNAWRLRASAAPRRGG